MLFNFIISHKRPYLIYLLINNLLLQNNGVIAFFKYT